MECEIFMMALDILTSWRGIVILVGRQELFSTESKLLGSQPLPSWVSFINCKVWCSGNIPIVEPGIWQNCRVERGRRDHGCHEYHDKQKSEQLHGLVHFGFGLELLG